MLGPAPPLCLGSVAYLRVAHDAVAIGLCMLTIALLGRKTSAREVVEKRLIVLDFVFFPVSWCICSVLSRRRRRRLFFPPCLVDSSFSPAYLEVSRDWHGLCTAQNPLFSSDIALIYAFLIFL
jgi:hypothetical protein